jgi:hypothetical protein
MERPEPRQGDIVIVNGRRSRIDGFDKNGGARLRNSKWVCMSEFIKNAEGAWVREAEAMSGVPELERPAKGDAAQALSAAAEHLRQSPLRYVTDERYALLLADSMQALGRIGSYGAEFLDRVGGAEMVRLARFINANA